jgi:hypothetical protein
MVLHREGKIPKKSPSADFNFILLKRVSQGQIVFLKSAN